MGIKNGWVQIVSSVPDGTAKKIEHEARDTSRSKSKMIAEIIKRHYAGKEDMNEKRQ